MAESTLTNRLGRAKYAVVAALVVSGLAVGLAAVAPAAPAQAACGAFSYLPSGPRKGYMALTNCNQGLTFRYDVTEGAQRYAIVLKPNATFYTLDRTAFVQGAVGSRTNK